MKRGQSGFGVIETLLVLILLAILGFTGYYIYHSQQNTNKTYDSAAKTSASTPTPSSSKTSNKFVIKELGVQFDLTPGLKGLAYTVQHFSDGDAVYFTLPAFKEVNDKCYGKADGETAAGPSFAAIGKGTGTFDPSQAAESGLLKQFSGYYISVSYPNGITLGCGDNSSDDSVQAAAHKYQQDFVNAFKATAIEVK